MSYLKVKDKNNLLRDQNTKAIINCSVEDYALFEEEYHKKISDLKRIKSLENDVTEIKNDLTEIKNLLRNLANGS
jgi:conjugal transfer/entry exclusion protein